ILLGPDRNSRGGVVIRQKQRAPLSHCAFDDRGQHWFVARGHVAGPPRAQCRHVLPGRGGNLCLLPGLLVLADELSRWHGRRGLDWADQFSWESWWLCGSACGRLFEHADGLVFWWIAVSFAISSGGGWFGALD